PLGSAGHGERLGLQAINDLATVHRIEFAGNGDRIVSVYASEPGVAVWDIPQRRIIARITAGEQGFFTCAAITRDGRQILTGTQAGELALWNTDNGALVRRFAGHAEQTLAVGISPDGSRA